MIPEVKPNYRCSQQELYLAGENVIANCTTLLVDFSRRFKSYRLDYLNTVTTLIN